MSLFNNLFKSAAGQPCKNCTVTYEAVRCKQCEEIAIIPCGETHCIDQKAGCHIVRSKIVNPSFNDFTLKRRTCLRCENAFEEMNDRVCHSEQPTTCAARSTSIEYRDQYRTRLGACNYGAHEADLLDLGNQLTPTVPNSTSSVCSSDYSFVSCSALPSNSRDAHLESSSNKLAADKKRGGTQRGGTSMPDYDVRDEVGDLI